MTKTEIEKCFTLETREFNPVVFAHLFTKVRTIAFSTNSLSNKEFLQYRELLIKELNYYSKAIALDFARVLSNQNLQTYSKDFFNLIWAQKRNSKLNSQVSIGNILSFQILQST